MATAQMDDRVAAEIENDGATHGEPIGGDLTEGVGQVTGESANKGLRLPRLQIVYGVGNLAKEFTPGDLVYGGDNLLAHKGEKVECVIWKAVEYWKEYLDAAAFNAGIRPRVFLTEAEVLKAGGITRWPPYGEEGPKPNFSNAMDLSLLIRKPEGIVCGLFGIEIEGAEYGVAIWSVDKTTYKRVAPHVKMCQNFSLRKRGMLSGRFTLHTTIEQIKGRVTPMPTFKLTGHNSDGFIAAVSAMLGVPVPVRELAAGAAAAAALPEKAG